MKVLAQLFVGTLIIIAGMAVWLIVADRAGLEQDHAGPARDAEYQFLQCAGWVERTMPEDHQRGCFNFGKMAYRNWVAHGGADDPNALTMRFDLQLLGWWDHGRGVPRFRPLS